MDDENMTDIKTSQTDWSRSEGQENSSGAGENEYGDEMAPTGLSTKEATSDENAFKTTQQIKGEHSLVEG